MIPTIYGTTGSIKNELLLRIIHAVCQTQTVYAAPLDEAGEGHFIASIRNYVQLQRSQAQTKVTPGIIGNPETIYCLHAHLTPDTLRRKQRRASDKVTFVEQTLHALKISRILGPMRLSQQEGTQLESFKKSFMIICMEVG